MVAFDVSGVASCLHWICIPLLRASGIVWKFGRGRLEQQLALYINHALSSIYGSYSTYVKETVDYLVFNIDQNDAHVRCTDAHVHVMGCDYLRCLFFKSRPASHQEHEKLTTTFLCLDFESLSHCCLDSTRLEYVHSQPLRLQAMR